MTERATLDSNIAIYALTGLAKAAAANRALRASAFLSTQVLNEVANVTRRKLGHSWAEVNEFIEKLEIATPSVIPLRPELSRDAVRIAQRYRLSFHDSLMLAAALSGGAQAIYSEDMQHGLVIDDTLRIVDPFR